MQDEQPDKWPDAVHQSGHAAAASCFGWPIRELSIQAAKASEADRVGICQLAIEAITTLHPPAESQPPRNAPQSTRALGPRPSRHMGQICAIHGSALRTCGQTRILKSRTLTPES